MDLLGGGGLLSKAKVVPFTPILPGSPTRASTLGMSNPSVGLIPNPSSLPISPPLTSLSIGMSNPSVGLIPNPNSLSINSSGNKGKKENDPEITGEYPVLLNIAGEYILIHKQSEKFKSNNFSKVIGSMWVELQPKYGVDPNDTAKIDILRKTFGVLQILQQPAIMTTMCAPEDKDFIVKMLKFRITTLKQELPFLSPSLVKSKKEQQIKNLEGLIAMIDGLSPDAPKCKPIMPTSYKIPSLTKKCDEEIALIKKLLELIKSLHGEDGEDANIDALIAEWEKGNKDELRTRLLELIARLEKKGRKGINAETSTVSAEEEDDTSNILQETLEEIEELRRLARIDEEDEEEDKGSVLTENSNLDGGGKKEDDIKIKDKIIKYFNELVGYLNGTKEALTKAKAQCESDKNAAEEKYEVAITALKREHEAALTKANEDCDKEKESLLERIKKKKDFLKEKKAEIKELEALLELLNKQIEELEAALFKAKEDLAAAQSRISELEAAGINSTALKEAQARITELEGQLSKARSDLAKKDAEYKAAVEEKNALEAGLAVLEGELGAKDAEHAAAIAVLEEQHRAALAVKDAEKVTAIAALNAEHAAALAAKDLENQEILDKQRIDADIAINELRRSSNACNTSLAACQAKTAELEAQLAARTGPERILELEAQIANLIAQLDERPSPEIIAALQAQLAALRAQLAARPDPGPDIAALQAQLTALQAEKTALENQIRGAVGDEVLGPDFNLKAFFDNLKAELAKCNLEKNAAITKNQEIFEKINRLIALLKVDEELKANIQRWLNGKNNDGSDLEENFFKDNIETEVASILNYTDLLLDYVLLPLEKSNLTTHLKNDVFINFGYNNRNPDWEFKELKLLLEEVFTNKNLFKRSTHDIHIEIDRSKYPYLKSLLEQEKHTLPEGDLTLFKLFFEKKDDIFYLIHLEKDRSSNDIQFTHFNKIPSYDLHSIPLRLLAIRFFQLYRTKIQKRPKITSAASSAVPSAVPSPSGSRRQSAVPGLWDIGEVGNAHLTPINQRGIHPLPPSGRPSPGIRTAHTQGRPAVDMGIITGRHRKGGSIEDIDTDPLEVYDHNFINLEDVL